MTLSRLVSFANSRTMSRHVRKGLGSFSTMAQRMTIAGCRLSATVPNA